MRKVILMALSLTFISSLLYGCQSKEKISTETTVNQSTKSETNNELLIDNNFKSVSVSKTKGVDEITIYDKESIHAFQNIFSSAVKEPGVVDMAGPEFYLEVIYDKEKHQNLYLWIGKKGQRSTFMKTDDTSTIYTVLEEKTNKLIELIESSFN
ncbi:hypothetical protein J5Y03_04680 [Bacillus sp. RG28]|uniref:YhfM-like domain-containing protein n=1 Tax=Gottfriedia endophytica TaxID=2820819 RepID=A0A940NTB0_9BACI|nr:hypothetical protein [Gottfriedia endophytica]MBP0724483.1 hypothetical protein [Gottfriedia endophytica]